MIPPPGQTGKSRPTSVGAPTLVARPVPTSGTAAVEQRGPVVLGAGRLGVRVVPLVPGGCASTRRIRSVRRGRPAARRRVVRDAVSATAGSRWGRPQLDVALPLAARVRPIGARAFLQGLANRLSSNMLHLGCLSRADRSVVLAATSTPRGPWAHREGRAQDRPLRPGVPTGP
jgi:hypothetical protein